MSEKKVSIGSVIYLIIIFVLIMSLAGMWYYYNHIKGVEDSAEITGTEVEINNNEEITQEYEENTSECNKVHQELDEDLARFITENYLDLEGRKAGDYRGFLEYLKLVDEVKMNSEETITISDGFKLWKTNIKYSDYKAKLLKYMSANCFEQFSSNGFAEKDGYLYTVPGGASGYSYDTYDAKLKEQNDKYSVYKVKAECYGPSDQPEYYDIEATIIKENGRYVLDSYKDIEMELVLY